VEAGGYHVRVRLIPQYVTGHAGAAALLSDGPAVRIEVWGQPGVGRADLLHSAWFPVPGRSVGELHDDGLRYFRFVCIEGPAYDAWLADRIAETVAAAQTAAAV
jgi:hypothetical protein